MFIFQPFGAGRTQHNVDDREVSGRPSELMKEFRNACSIKTLTVHVVNKWSLSFSSAKVVAIGVTLVNHALS